jgi:hypothetical protein
MKKTALLCAALLGAAFVAPQDAYAKGAKKDKPQIVELTSTGKDFDAEGKVKVHAGKKGDQTVIELSKLKPKTVYEVRDKTTGELLGTVKTNRKGKASFNLTKTLAKSASVGGSDADDVDDVEIVDPATGDSVLEGDVDPPAPEPAEGYADYYDDDGDAGSAYLSSWPEYGESFSLSFMPAASEDDSKFSYYDFNRSTADGDELPLGVDTVAELGGRAFEIRDADGNVALAGELPEVETLDFDWGDDGNGIREGEWDDWGDWGGDKDEDWSNWLPEGGWSDWGGYDDGWNPAGGDDGRNGITKSGKRNGGVKEDAADFTLFVADENGDLQNAGAFHEETYEYEDPGCGYGGGVIIFVIVGDDADLQALLEELFGSVFTNEDWSSYAGDWGW